MSTIVSGPICAIGNTRRTGVPDEVHAMLVLWGSWRARTANSGPAGYPRQSPFVKSALYGKLGIPQESNVRVDNDVPPAMVDQVESIVAGMPADLSSVLEVRYGRMPERTKNERMDDLFAKQLGMSRYAFRCQLERAHWCFYGRLYA